MPRTGVVSCPKCFVPHELGNSCPVCSEPWKPYWAGGKLEKVTEAAPTEATPNRGILDAEVIVTLTEKGRELVRYLSQYLSGNQLRLPLNVFFNEFEYKVNPEYVVSIVLCGFSPEYLEGFGTASTRD